MEEDIPLLQLLPVLMQVAGLKDAHKKFGITKSQLNIFIGLFKNGNMTMSEISQYISSSKEQATRTVASLCEQGLVERYENPSNRTHVHVRFTDKGREYMKYLSQQVYFDISEKLHACLSEDEILSLRESLKNTLNILSKVK